MLKAKILPMKNLKFERNSKEYGYSCMQVESVSDGILVYIHQNLLSTCYRLNDEEAEQLAKHLLEQTAGKMFSEIGDIYKKTDSL